MDNTPELLTELARLGQRLTHEVGTVVVSEGDPSDSLYLIHEGRLRVVVSGDAGRKVELASLGPGEMFGELMLSAERRTASVVVTQQAELTRVDRTAFEAELARKPELALLVAHHLMHRVRALTDTVRQLASVDVYGRLVGLFNALAVHEDGQLVVPGPLSQARMAERLGSSKSMINRLLKDLATGGYIELSRQRIVLLRKLPPRW